MTFRVVRDSGPPPAAIVAVRARESFPPKTFPIVCESQTNDDNKNEEIKKKKVKQLDKLVLRDGTARRP